MHQLPAVLALTSYQSGEMAGFLVREVVLLFIAYRLVRRIREASLDNRTTGPLTNVGLVAVIALAALPAFGVAGPPHAHGAGRAGAAELAQFRSGVVQGCTAGGIPEKSCGCFADQLIEQQGIDTQPEMLDISNRMAAAGGTKDPAQMPREVREAALACRTA